MTSSTSSTSSALILISRFLLAAIFLLAGINKFVQWSATEEFMRANGLPVVPVLLPIVASLEIAGALALVVGLLTRPAAFGLALFLIPTSFFFHDFWNHAAADQTNQMQHFLKNLAIMGGLFGLTAVGAGAFSLDALFRNPPLEVNRRRSFA